MDHLKAGVEDICGHWSHYQLRDKFKKFDNKYVKKILIREHQPKSSIVSLYKKMEIKLAIEMAESGMKISEAPAASLQSARNQHVHRLSPSELESMRDVLAHNLYQVRQRAPTYSRHNLTTNTNEKQAQEILIRRQHSLRQSCRKGNSLPWGGQASIKDVRYLSLPQGPSQHTRQKAKRVTFTDHCRSSGTAFPMMFRPQPRLRPLEAKYHQEELIPMAHLDRQAGSSHMSGQRGNLNPQHHFTRGDNVTLMPKSQLTVGDIEQDESEEETETVASVKSFYV